MGAFQDRGGRGVAVEGGNASAKLPTSSQNDVVLPRYRLMLSKGACREIQRAHGVSGRSTLQAWRNVISLLLTVAQEEGW
jgi:hypothetical protein